MEVISLDNYWLTNLEYNNMKSHLWIPLSVLLELGQFNLRFRSTRTLVPPRKFDLGIVNDCFVRYAIHVGLKRAFNSCTKHSVPLHVWCLYDTISTFVLKSVFLTYVQAIVKKGQCKNKRDVVLGILMTLCWLGWRVNKLTSNLRKRVEF